MNNIKGVNIITLKQAPIEETDNDFKDHIYSVTAATQNQKKNLKIKKFQSILRITKPARRNFKKSIAN